MPKAKGSLAKQIAALEVSNPKDFDPEEDVQYGSESGSEESSGDENAGTEHYEKVGRSKLRKPVEVALGPKYTGSKVSREAAFADDDDEDEESEEEEVSEEEVDSEFEEDGEGPFAELDTVDVEGGMGIDDEDGDIDSDAAFGESDDDKFDKFVFRGSGKPRDADGKKQRPTASDFMSDSEEENLKEEDETDEDVLDTDAQHAEDNDEAESEDVDMESEGGAPIEVMEDEEEEEEDESDNEDQSDQGSDTSLRDDESEESEDDEDDKARRDELKALMGEEQQTVVAMSQAAKADAAKGNAVRAQRKAFDQLLHTRMDLQKALIASNSLSAVENTKLDDEAYAAAESAALKLWSTLDSLRLTLSKATDSNSKSSTKRKREVDSTTDSSILWDRMQAHEVSMLHNRQSILDKWSTKIRGTDAQPVTRKLNPSGPAQPLSSLLQDQLASSDHLIQKTRIPRSCAPLQREARLVEDTNIYDDGPFYQLLLKELVDQRRVETINGSTSADNVLGWTAVKEVKARKNVDTKASKGRKMRYNVHEKLQNYMAPEDRGSWEEEAVARFFGTLLGQKMTLVEEDVNGDEVEGLEPEEEGLKLFRS